MRVFLAIELDDASRAAVVAEQRRVLGAMGTQGRTLRMVRAEQLHVTLVFLGEVDAALSRAVVHACEAPIPRAPYAVSFAGLGTFPAEGAPRVLWLGMVRGAAETQAVHGELLARLAPLELGMEARAFTPHLTLGRWRQGRPRDRRALPSRPTTIATMEVDAVTIFQSRLESDRAVHTVLARAPLVCR